MKKILQWFNPNIKMKRWLALIFVGAIAFAYAISNLIIYDELKIDTFLITAVLFTIGATIIIISFLLAQNKILEIITGINILNENDNKKIQKLFRDKCIYDENPQICIIGTGVGLSNIISSVKQYTNNIDVLIPFYESDVHNSFVNLATSKEVMEKSFDNNYMLTQIEVFKNKYGNYEDGFKNICEFLSMCGHVIPISFDEIKYTVRLSDGLELSSNDNITQINIEKGTKIEKVELLENPVLSEEAANAIKNAKLIILAPCNLYTELIPMLLIENLFDLCKKSKGKTALLNNIMTVSGETTFYDLYDHINAININTDSKLINYVVCDKGNIDYSRLVKDYNQTSSEPVKYDREKFDKRSSLKVICKDLSVIDSNNNIVYDVNKIANVIGDILIDMDKNKIKEKTNKVVNNVKNRITDKIKQMKK